MKPQSSKLSILKTISEELKQEPQEVPFSEHLLVVLVLETLISMALRRL